jgi:hypothetical protein
MKQTPVQKALTQGLTVRQRKAQMSPGELAASNAKWDAFKQAFKQKVRDEYHLPRLKVKKLPRLPSLKKLAQEPPPPLPQPPQLPKAPEPQGLPQLPEPPSLPNP